jgi:glycosyltransferase involved in cell wall biosynthesis
LSDALVSVVTPFHNTSSYLAECIESVLAQTHTHFEYILVDNCSTDGSGEIASAYAKRDPRIRFIRRSQLLSQVQNYNTALAETSAASHYCKIVQADDSIFPDCLRLMVEAFEQSETIGLVSSYYLKGNFVRGSGFPFSSSFLSGKEMARLYMRTGVYVFGSPTTVMYRASIVRNQNPFYDEGLLHEDTEKCLQILEKWDFGFVPQVLSFLRVGNESISSTARDFDPDALDWYILAQRYASMFLDDKEAAALKAKSRREYYSVLARATLRFREPAFWKYHEDGLKTINETVDRGYLKTQILKRAAWLLVNPGELLARVFSKPEPKASNPSPPKIQTR